MRKSTFLISVSVFMVFCLAIFVGINFENRSKAKIAYASLEPVIRQVAVIDMNRVGIFTPKMVLNGKLPILALHTGGNSDDHSRDILNFLDIIGPLSRFDLDDSNRIDSSDKVYFQLELVYLKGAQITQIIPISHAAILSIYIDKGRTVSVALTPQGGPKGYWNMINTVFLADGSTRTMRVVPMNSSDLPQLGKQSDILAALE